MIKRLPSRNHRSKGIKVKRVLQITLLLGVCFWLIYQVKHNHDKKKEFDENDAKLSVRAQTDQVLQLGRRGLHPGKDEVNQNEKHEEEEEDENIVEDEENKHEHNEQEEEEEGNKHETEESEDNKYAAREQGEEENSHGAEEQEEDENKSEEMEDEGRGGGGGDDETDEIDQEKSEFDADRNEEFMDEEKEKEEGDEKENENSEGEEKGGSVENHNTHEAREEHYKGDDASSAVAHDTHTTSTEIETFSLENSDVNLEMNITKPENKTTYSYESNRNQNDSDLKVKEGELTDGTSSNATAGKETGTNSLFNPLDSSYLNKTATTNSDSHLAASSDMTVVTTEASNNLTGAGSDTSSSSQQNKAMILSESDHAQNTMANRMVTGDLENVRTEGLEQSGNRLFEKNLPDTDSTVSVKTEHGDAAAGEPSNLGAGELNKTIRFVATNETENNSRNLDRNESSDTSEIDKSKGNTETSETNETKNLDATEDEMLKGDTQTDEPDETSDSSSANETLDSVEHDAIDSSDSHIDEDVTKVRTDLDTLPDIRNGDNDDETAAE